MQAWREEVGVLPYVRGITFSGEVFDLGNPVEAVLSHPDPERLARIADSVVDGLRGVGGVYDIRSDHTPGIPEMQLELRPEARTLGLTLGRVGRAGTRAAFSAQRPSGCSAAGKRSGSTCACPPMSGIPSPMSKDTCSVRRAGPRSRS